MASSRRQWIKLATAALSAAWLGISAIPAPAFAADKITVFAAASMKNALDNIDAAFTKETGKQVTVSYAASGPLAKQLENGAPADVFISADTDWMDYVAKKKLIKDGSRVNLLGNKIVLVSAKDKAKPVEIKQGMDLADLLGDGRLAIGQPESVPAGKYGKAALEKLGVWSSVEKKVAGAESVRAALALVSRGEAPYGIVYQTDVSADPAVTVVGTFPEDSHPPIIYPIAITANSTNPDTQAYVDYLKSAKAVPFFEHEGFTVLKR
ncbi:molybdate ABC transporter substrate-binding protein [Rhizobium leucaenae]|uniref:Molybdate transport system substrate-binding protein n=1 Tax=Rhizobium leucaenae TaxID=29450 RepID=A0A7W7ELX9_9HYPH|nr:molybdate ABC transporter substrate-binding protein [Rhizobium leucaenae]MBB4570345.1 molybdate transport system substrate-binding protein [Rhizobium leucaenae]MBB6301079.1 molybdate transport system substrate-binding protein [Rhizobium leucaenae]